MFTKNQQQIIEFLRRLTAISEAEISQVIKLFHPVEVKKNEYFIEAGQIATELGFVVSGIMRLYYLSETGDEYTKSFCTENEFIGAYSALLLSEPSQLYIQALEDTVLMAIATANIKT